MQTHCKRGHGLNGSNLGIDYRGNAKCRACAIIFKETKRPYIPRRIRVDVLLRQCEERNFAIPKRQKDTLSIYIKTLQLLLFGNEKVHLDHNPALVNRIFKDGVYSPDANDPRFLAYLPEKDHRTKTYIRGLNGQHSDLGLARKLKRIEKKRENRPFKGVAAKRKARNVAASDSRAKLRAPKRKWPSRPFAQGRKFNMRRAP